MAKGLEEEEVSIWRAYASGAGLLITAGLIAMAFPFANDLYRYGKKKLLGTEQTESTENGLG